MQNMPELSTIDLSTLEPTVSLPHLPSNTRRISEVKGMPIQQAVIGSCTNGRIEDLRAAAAILEGRHVATGVRCIVIPATQAIYLQAMHEGLVRYVYYRGLRCFDADLRPLPGRAYGRYVRRRAGCFHHEPQFCRPHGPHQQ